MKRGRREKPSFQEKLSQKHPIIAAKINKSLDGSITEGNYASAMGGFGISYFSPFALALNATSSQIGILNSVMGLLPSVAQLKASRLIEKYSRKKIVIISTFLQALMFIPIIFSAYLFTQGYVYTIWFLIGSIGLFYIFGGVAHPAWFSWMGSLVPKDSRGKYFSKRNRITGFFGLATIVIGALILDKFESLGLVLIGFGVLFALAMLCRTIATALFFRHYEPRLKVHKKDYFSFWDFLKKGRGTPFGRFTFFTSAMRVATNIAGPFFAVYMLKSIADGGLGLSYVWFMGIIVSGSVFQLFFYPAWGKFSDRFGNIQVLRISCIAIALVPFLWLISKNPIYLITVPQIISGFGWAGFFLATNNYVYDSVREEKQGLGISYFNLLNGIGLFVGAGIGAVVVSLNIPFMNALLFVFLISSGARLLVCAAAARSLREVRHVSHFSKQYMIREFNPATGMVREIHRLNHLKAKIEHYI